MRPFLKIVRDARCSGTRIHDAAILAAAQTHGVPHLITCNTDDFAGLAVSIQIVKPAEALAALH